MSANSREPREIEIRGTQIRGTPYLFPAFLVAPFLGFSPGLARAERAAEALFELGDKRVSAQRTPGSLMLLQPLDGLRVRGLSQELAGATTRAMRGMAPSYKPARQSSANRYGVP